MMPPPNAAGCILCEQVIVDQRSKRPTLINVLSALTVDSFPSEPCKFYVFATLSGGHGDAIIELAINRLDTLDEVHRQKIPIRFQDPITSISMALRVRDVCFPVAGWYELALFIDGDLIAQRRFEVRSSAT